MEAVCLVHILHPGQMLPAASSVSHIAKRRGQLSVRLLLNNPCLPEIHHDLLLNTVTTMTEALGWGEPLYLNESNMESIFSAYSEGGRDSMRGCLEDLLGFVVKEFHYAHNILGRTPESIMLACPEAEHYTYGDAFGNLFNKGYHLSIAQGCSLEEAVQQGHSFAAKPDCLDASTACLILPIDQTGDMLTDKKLIVVPKPCVLNVLSCLVTNLNTLNNYCRSLLKQTPSPKTLFLSEPIYEGLFAGFENAINMQVEMITAHVPLGGTIIIKGHPMSNAEVDDAMMESLSDKYTVIYVEKKFVRYPVELFQLLIEHCEVLSWSYSTLSLRYLYNKKVHHGASDKLFEKYLFKDRIFSMKNSNSLVVNPLKRLSSWQGEGPLYVGKYPE